MGTNVKIFEVHGLKDFFEQCPKILEAMFLPSTISVEIRDPTYWTRWIFEQKGDKNDQRRDS